MEATSITSLVRTVPIDNTYPQKNVDQPSITQAQIFLGKVEDVNH